MSCLLVLIDACREDNISPELTPFIYSLKERGACSKLDFMSSFNARVELLTGNSPLTTDTMYDYCLATGKSPLRWLRFLKPPARLRSGNKLREYVIRRVGTRLNRLFTGSVVGIAPNIPLALLPYFSINHAFDRFMEQERKLDPGHLFGAWNKHGYDYRFICGDAGYITRNLQKPTPAVKYALLLHYEDLELFGHEEGPFSDRKPDALKAIDASVQRIYQRFESDIEFIAVFGDHNMEEVREQIDLWVELQKLSVKMPQDYLVFLNSPVARFWFYHEKAREEIRQFLNTLGEYGREIPPEELQERGLSADPKYGELIFWLKKGVNITPDFYHEININGMHHYFDNPARTPFILFHRDKRFELREDGKLRDVMPTVLELLKIPSRVDGESLIIGERP